MSIAFSIASSTYKRIQCFLFQFPESSGFLKVIQQLLTSSTLSLRHVYSSSYLSFNNVFYNTTPTQDGANPTILPYFFTVCWIFLDLLHPSPATHLKIFQNCSSAVSKFHQHTMLCSKCSTSLVSSLKLSTICW